MQSSVCSPFTCYVILINFAEEPHEFHFFFNFAFINTCVNKKSGYGNHCRLGHWRTLVYAASVSAMVRSKVARAASLCVRLSLTRLSFSERTRMSCCSRSFSSSSCLICRFSSSRFEQSSSIPDREGKVGLNRASVDLLGTQKMISAIITQPKHRHGYSKQRTRETFTVIWN